MKTVVILLFDGVEELDFCGPHAVLASCRRVIGGHWSDKPAFHVETAAEHRTTIKCSHGLSVFADRTLAEAHEADIVIVPGGPGARRDPVPLHIVEYLRHARETADVIASVCTGAFLLAKLGLADNRLLTTHAAKVDELARLYPKVKVVKGRRVVSDGPKQNLMSSGGISAGIDLALALVARFESWEAARLSARRLEWLGHEYERPAP